MEFDFKFMLVLLLVLSILFTVEKLTADLALNIDEDGANQVCVSSVYGLLGVKSAVLVGLAILAVFLNYKDTSNWYLAALGLFSLLSAIGAVSNWVVSGKIKSEDDSQAEKAKIVSHIGHYGSVFTVSVTTFLFFLLPYLESKKLKQ